MQKRWGDVAGMASALAAPERGDRVFSLHFGARTTVPLTERGQDEAAAALSALKSNSISKFGNEFWGSDHLQF